MPLAPRPSSRAPRFDAARLRRTILDMSLAGSTVHVPCAFSIVEILAVLYRSYLRLDANDPRAPDRDYLVLSKGHGVMAQYACLNELGWVSDAELRAYFGDGTRLKGLADAHVPGIEATAGSLGHGLSVAMGLAMAAKRRGSRQRVFAIVGDGEANEGAVWEALLFAAHNQLSNSILIIDANGMQAMGSTAEVMDLGSIVTKLAAFGFMARETDGHDEAALSATLDELLSDPSPRPKGLVARTVKGKGVSFMEHNNRWHYTRLTPETHAAAMAELAT